MFNTEKTLGHYRSKQHRLLMSSAPSVYVMITGFAGRGQRQVGTMLLPEGMRAGLGRQGTGHGKRGNLGFWILTCITARQRPRITEPRKHTPKKDAVRLVSSSEIILPRPRLESSALFLLPSLKALPEPVTRSESIAAEQYHACPRRPRCPRFRSPVLLPIMFARKRLQISQHMACTCDQIPQ